MNTILFILFVLAIFIAAAMIVDKKPKQIMSEGKLLKREVVYRNGDKFYVEKVGFKDWHISIHFYYLISDRLTSGQTFVDQRWSYEDFCNVTTRFDDYTMLLIRQVDVVTLVRSFRPIPINEFDRIAMSLIM